MYIHLHVHQLPWSIRNSMPSNVSNEIQRFLQGNDVHIFNHTPLQILAYAKTCRFLYIYIYIYIYTYEGFLKWGYHFLKQPMLIGFSMMFSIQLLEIPYFKNPLGTGGGSELERQDCGSPIVKLERIESAIGTPTTKNTRYIRYIRYKMYIFYIYIYVKIDILDIIYIYIYYTIYIYMLKIIGDNDTINQERLSKRPPSCVLYAPRGRTICI